MLKTTGREGPRVKGFAWGKDKKLHEEKSLGARKYTTCCSFQAVIIHKAENFYLVPPPAISAQGQAGELRIMR